MVGPRLRDASLIRGLPDARVAGALIAAALGVVVNSFELAAQGGKARLQAPKLFIVHMLKTAANPGGLPLSVFDGIRTNVVTDRSDFYKQLAVPFYGYNKPGAKTMQGVIDSFWLQGMAGGIKGQYDCIKQFSEVDFTGDLRKMAIPTLVMHGDADQIVPIADSAERSVKILPHATLRVYPGAPHGLCTTQADKVNADLLTFVNS